MVQAFLPFSSIAPSPAQQKRPTAIRPELFPLEVTKTSSGIQDIGCQFTALSLQAIPHAGNAYDLAETATAG